MVVNYQKSRFSVGFLGNLDQAQNGKTKTVKKAVKNSNLKKV